ncbi:MAG: iron-containing redox enzyme family protein, partial [Actinomycetota bacterium]|nr:iron-containing redox enzyme family protein [Actinomycetota bacterium]
MPVLATPRAVAATLPQPRGPLSEAVLDVLAGNRPSSDLTAAGAATSDPFGEDLQLALYAGYELHYRS